MNRRVMAVTAAAVMSMSGFAVPAMADEEDVIIAFGSLSFLGEVTKTVEGGKE